ncbi:hypothetical protein LAT59_00370 [Candidatus Gracilibacteria bacterium]|nr:hypothetical protein [Candidatus Gracilibacteria bacterium]
MKASRTKTRRLLLQKLYTHIYTELDEDLFEGAFFEGRFDFAPDEVYLKEMIAIILEKQDILLDIISEYAPRFDIDTMLKTNILAIMVALAEMLYLTEEIPAKVSIDEAISLSKYYGDDTSKNIVNGILHSFYKNIESHTKKNINTTKKQYHFFHKKLP